MKASAVPSFILAVCFASTLFVPSSGFAQLETLLQMPLASVSDKDFTLLKITLPPLTGNDNPEQGHRHPGDTIVYVESGTVTNQMGNQPPQEYQAGEYWVEGPEELHAVFRNNDPEETAVVIVFMVTGHEEPLTHR